MDKNGRCSNCLSVLVVDDEKSIRTGLAYIIRSKFNTINVMEASNGFEAWDLIRETANLVLIFLDIRMPGMDGLRLCEKILMEGISTKIVILSGHTDFEYARQAFRCGVLDYLLKPVNPTDVAKFVTAALQDKQLTQKVSDFNDMCQVQQVIEKIRSWIHDHLDKEITLTQIANELHYTPNYLSTLFKKVIGKGFQEYLTECRMRRAKHLLKDPALRIFEVSEKVGYMNSKAFSIAFRKAFNITPTEYRGSFGINVED